MSTEQTPNPPAFPNNEGCNDSHGMDLLDYFAAKAMQSQIITLSNDPNFQGNGYVLASVVYVDLAKYSYEIAQAMLKVRSEIK